MPDFKGEGAYFWALTGDIKIDSKHSLQFQLNLFRFRIVIYIIRFLCSIFKKTAA